MKQIVVLLHTTVLVGLFCGYSNVAFAEPEKDRDESLQEANANLVKLLDEVDNLFYKKKKDDKGNVFYTVVWEMDGETTKIIVGLKDLGHYKTNYVYAINSWTNVASSKDPLPPAAIKAVATANDTLLVGNYSCSKDFKKVYANMNGILDNATPGTIWMYCAYLHSNRIKLKEQIDLALTGAGR